MFYRKSVYAKWAQQDRLRWARDSNELKSARILLEEACAAGQGGESLYGVEPIELPELDGFTAVAFALPEIIRQWGGRIRELALDSTCTSVSRLSNIL